MSFQVQGRSARSARACSHRSQARMLPYPAKVAQSEPYSDLSLLPHLAEERFVGDANALFAGE